jgi:hypothetical protein
MKVSDYVWNKIGNFPKGYVFAYSDFQFEANSKEAVIKSLNRLAQAGEINKLAKGKFYKPEQTPFGDLLPDERQLVKDLLEKDGKIVGYLTGYNVYNQLGLSTQVGNIIQIGRINVRPATKRGNFKIVFIRQKNTITKDNIPLLQLLDAINNIKKIPDAPLVQSCKRFVAIISELSLDHVNSLVKLALKYPPATRALLGAFLDQAEIAIDTTALYKSLNPISNYKMSIGDAVLQYAEKWNIV